VTTASTPAAGPVLDAPGQGPPGDRGPRVCHPLLGAGIRLAQHERPHAHLPLRPPPYVTPAPFG